MATRRRLGCWGVSEGELLIGDGVTQGIVRIGATVRRPLRPFSLTVQAYLAHLRDAGFTGAPLPFGVDEQGREVLRDGLPVALIDFDLAMPTTRLYDIANALWYWARLRGPRDRAPAFRGRRHPAPGRGVCGRLRYDGAAAR